MEKHLKCDPYVAKELVDKLEKNEQECNEELQQFFTDTEIKYPYLLSLALNKMDKPKVFEVLKTLDNQQKKKRGISNQQVCVLSCVDVNGNQFLQPVCVGRIEPKHIEKYLVPHLTGGTILVTDSHRAYRTVANKYKIPHRQIPSGKHTSNGFSLAHINGYHRNINALVKKYVETSTKYADLYLALYYWQVKNSKMKMEEKIEVILDLLAHQAKKVYLHKFKFKPLPIDMKGILDS